MYSREVFVKQLRLLAVAILALAALTVAPAMAQDIRIVVVSHGQASDPFWSVVKNGVDDAQEDMGVSVEYLAPDTFDMVRMAQMIDTAVRTVWWCRSPTPMRWATRSAPRWRPAFRSCR